MNPPQCPACSAEFPKEDPGPPRDEDPGTLEVTGEVKSKTADLRKEDEGEAGEEPDSTMDMHLRKALAPEPLPIIPRLELAAELVSTLSKLSLRLS